ncbi:pseudouridine synthase [Kockovaella imperatae]|uniref:Pseudouridine synthase n=1 Tax=Kockovaella imperatae TaxID=4999 RepID=A0A1Y1URJ2_9TREE|nr:pseudouridine synthase [Kockovaella imperatae]ORX40227.1 pseudouridine synthase [Kockovaella imperatae]
MSVQNIATDSSTQDSAGPSRPRQVYPRGQNPKLRYEPFYWWPYRTYVKERWIGRELLEVISTEFRDRSVDYYRHALESGVTTVNGVRAGPNFVLRNGDRIDNTVHRHEPPITNDEIPIIHLDTEREFVVISKPGSIPVHATGRYFRNTVLELMKSEKGMTVYAVNRLDRLTSGLMILALSSKRSQTLALEFRDGNVKKEYIARVRGEFPEGVVEVDLPLLGVDRQMGLVIVTPEGKEAKTLFRRLSYDPERDESVVHCRPLTGRTHQIRVHLQYIGYPIANDPLYSHASIWGPEMGKGGVDLVPHDPTAKARGLAARVVEVRQGAGESSDLHGPLASTLLKDEDRDLMNLDITSPIPLSKQARDIIVKLRRLKDESEAWAKWNDVVFRAKEAQDKFEQHEDEEAESVDASGKPARRKKKSHPRPETTRSKNHIEPLPPGVPSPLRRPEYVPEGFCEECYVPLADDPDPETLFIYLHAVRYTTEKLGAWQTPLPRWAGRDWQGDWRGWSEHAAPDAFDVVQGDIKVNLESPLV